MFKKNTNFNLIIVLISIFLLLSCSNEDESEYNMTSFVGDWICKNNELIGFHNHQKLTMNDTISLLKNGKSNWRLSITDSSGNLAYYQNEISQGNWNYDKKTNIISINLQAIIIEINGNNFYELTGFIKGYVKHVSTKLLIENENYNSNDSLDEEFCEYFKLE